MQFLTIGCGIIAALLTFNLFFSLLYLVSRSAGTGFYHWATHEDLEILTLLSFPFFGLTQYVASRCYDQFNWFKARGMLVLFSVLLLLLDLGFFISFIHFSEST